MYLTIIEVTKSSDFFRFIKDITVNLHISHSAQLLIMLEQLISRDLGRERYGILGQLVVGRFFLNSSKQTS